MLRRLAACLMFVAAVGCFPLPAFAEGPRAIDFTTLLRDLDGKPIPLEPQNAKSAPITLSDACVAALETPVETDRGMAGEQKFKLDELARRIYKSQHVVLQAEDVSTIKARVAQVYGPLIVGDVYRIIDPAVEEKK